MKTMTQAEHIARAVARQQAYFRIGATKDVPTRVAALRCLKAEIRARMP